MSAAARTARRGWCPGALRPMPSGDGLLVRLRLTGGILPAETARAIAAAARLFGNGLLDLGSRANLQIRGVSQKSLEALTRRLGTLGLLDADPEAEAVRNVLASPLAGLDPAAALDIRPVVAALEQRLRQDQALRGLPAKFGFIVDDGGVAASLAGIAADLRFDAFPGKDGPLFALSAGGTALSARGLSTCRPAELPDMAAAAAKAFLTLRGTGENAPARMRDLLASIRIEALAEQAGLALSAPARLGVPARRLALLGWHGFSPQGVLGVGAPFGRLAADDLAVLAESAARFGMGELRLTPWRAILLPGIDQAGADEIMARLGERFILDESDARLAVAACPGGPECASGSTATRQDALDLADLARALTPQGVGLHVSGCAKGCAFPAAAPVTLVGREGRYDLVLRGSARDGPARLGLDKAQAAALLRRLAGGLPP